MAGQTPQTVIDTGQRDLPRVDSAPDGLAAVVALLRAGEANPARLADLMAEWSDSSRQPHETTDSADGELNWAMLEPARLGTQFERSLDPRKRAQLGAHFTHRDDILLIIEPVLMEPLHRVWQGIIAEAAPLRERYQVARHTQDRAAYAGQLGALQARMLGHLQQTTILDPACGSGNFLVVALQRLMALEKAVIDHAFFADLPRPIPQVHPRQLYGIEIDPTARALACITVWIGYMQWRWHNGYPPLDTPVFDALLANIQHRDAILSHDAQGEPIRSPWPTVDVIVSNPPFLGSRKLRPELGDAYMDDLAAVFGPHFADLTPDLACYWFEQARQQLSEGRVSRVGLIATNSIRGGTNRHVLDRIAADGQIFMAWGDREWVLDGARVNVSMIGFDSGAEQHIVLDGLPVEKIYPDLTAGIDLTEARALPENRRIAFQGIVKRGPFDLPEDIALAMIAADAKNRDVLKPLRNGSDITGRPRHRWIVDFGVGTSREAAERYRLPFAYVETHVKPLRARTRQASSREHWWLHWNPRLKMRHALSQLDRYIAVSAVSKHPIFVWLDRAIHPDHALIVFARQDDYFFGVLHSAIHQCWAQQKGSALEDRPRYTPTTAFETFPFPWPPGHEDLSSPAYAAIGAAARQLYAERGAWLNRAESSAGRTLTNLYNALNVYRGRETIKTKPAARDFAPRLHELHRVLDMAVCEAYGWDSALLDSEAEILKRLLALNQGRSRQRF